jgi:glycerol-3-phosphate O-acyltransferase 1/2
MIERVFFAGGVLSVIVDAYLDGTIEDALLVPVSMNYDKLVDGNFIREQSGAPKEMESFTKACKSIWKILNSHYGGIRIDFNQPFSIQVIFVLFTHFFLLNRRIIIGISEDFPSTS